MRVHDRKAVRGARGARGATLIEWLLAAAFAAVFVAVMLPACGRAHRAAAETIESRSLSSAVLAAESL
jgi:hypothetical protein